MSAIQSATNPKFAKAQIPAATTVPAGEWQIPTPDDYAKLIGAAWQKSIDAIIEVGKLLIEAKAKLPHGKFQTLFTDQKVPFGERMAQQLMDVARHPIISNPNHGSHLPPHWRTLYELTKVPDKELQKKLGDGTINPETTRRDVERIAKECGFFRIPEALSVLITFMRNNPDAGIIAPHVLREVAARSPFLMDNLAKLVPWIAELHKSCQHLMDAAEKESGEAKQANVTAPQATPQPRARRRATPPSQQPHTSSS